MILLGPPHGECGSGEVWEITTLILSKRDALINTGGILTGSRPLQWQCTGELACQGPPLCSPHCKRTTSQGFSPSPGLKGERGRNEENNEEEENSWMALRINYGYLSHTCYHLIVLLTYNY